MISILDMSSCMLCSTVPYTTSGPQGALQTFGPQTTCQELDMSCGCVQLYTASKVGIVSYSFLSGSQVLEIWSISYITFKGMMYCCESIMEKHYEVCASTTGQHTTVSSLYHKNL